MKITTRIISLTASALLAVGILPTAAFAEENEPEKVRVIVENYTFPYNEEPPEYCPAWDGELLDVEVEIDESSTMASIVTSAVESEGYSIEMSYGSIADIEYLGTYTTAGGWSGWMFTLNDWFTDEGMSSYTVANGSIQDGDVIRVQYTVTGSDLGGSWYDNDTTLKAIDFSDGTLDKAFDPAVTEYTIVLGEGVDSITVTPTATNKNFQVRTYKNSYTPSVDGTEYRLSQSIKVADGDKIIVGVGNENWPSMNSYGGVTYPETVYTFNVVSETAINDKAAASEVEELIASIGTVTADSKDSITSARTAYERLTDVQKELVENYDVLVSAEEALAGLEADADQKTETELAEIYNAVGKYLSDGDAPVVGSVGGEWTVIGLARSGEISDSFAEGYFKNLYDYVSANGSEKLSSTKSTENSRAVLALTALGYDVTDVAGFNLLNPLADFDYLKKQGITGPVWALIALDSNNYEIPQTDAENPTTREGIVSYILENQLSDGSWSLDGSNGDIDTTAMVITSLAPYSDNEDVANAIESAIEWLSGKQTENGDFSSAESTAQVLVALSAINSDGADFSNAGKSILEGLTEYYSGEGQFAHSLSGEANRMATEQAYYALVSYYRFAEGKTSLFDMTDVEARTNPQITSPVESTPDNVVNSENTNDVNSSLADSSSVADNADSSSLADSSSDKSVSSASSNSSKSASSGDSSPATGKLGTAVSLFGIIAAAFAVTAKKSKK